MSDQENDQPGTIDAAEETAEELRDKIRYALRASSLTEPPINILDRVFKTAILVSAGPATVKSLSRVTGLRVDLVGDVLSGLIEAGSVTQARGNYRVAPRSETAPTTEAALTSAWKRLELATDCPKCGAPTGVECIQKSGTFTAMHTERRKAAMNGGPSTEAIAA